MEDHYSTALQVQLNNGYWLHVTPINPFTFRVRHSKTGHFLESVLSRYGILESLEPQCKYTILRNDLTLTLRTSQSELRISLEYGELNLFYNRGLQDECTIFRTCSEHTISLDIPLQEGETLYGLGDGMRGHLQKRGLQAQLWINENSPYLPIPYVMSSRGWGLLIAMTGHIGFDLGQSIVDRIHIEIPQSDDLDAYIFVGNNYGDLLDRYTDIVGKPNLMPLWGYGLSFVSNAKLGAREVLNEAIQFRQEGIPCDRIVLSEGWTKQPDQGRGELEWDPERFPLREDIQHQLPTFIEILRKHGFKLGVAIHCNYDVTYDPENKDQRSCSSPQQANSGQSWYSHLKSLTEDSVSSYQIMGNEQWMEYPNRIWGNGLSDQEVHNIIPVLLSKRIYEGMADQTGCRPFVINAMAGFTGIQRYASTLSGGRGQHREIGLISALSYGLSGHSNVTINMDLSTREGIHAGFLQPWSQVSYWSTFWNPHVLEQSLKDLFRTYAKLHYRLIPYIYSAAHIAAQTGMPIIRAMPLMYPEDPLSEKLSMQYMLGDSLLVAAFTRTVYLPEGEWIDYWTGDRHSGPQTLEYDIPKEAGGPLFIRAGAIIPQWADMDYIGQTQVENIELHIHPHKHSEFVLYEDDGITLRYKEGQIASTYMECNSNERRTVLRISRRKGTYEGMPLRRSYTLFLHRNGKPSSIKVNNKLYVEQKSGTRSGQRHIWHYDRHTSIVKLRVEEVPHWETAEDLSIEFQYSLASLPAEVRGKLIASKQATVNVMSSEGRFSSLELAVYRALDEGDYTECEESLSNWWIERTSNDSTSIQWKLQFIKATRFVVHYVESRGWEYEQYFNSDIGFVINLSNIKSSEQGLHILKRLYQQAAECGLRLSFKGAHPAVLELLHMVSNRLAEKLTLYDLAVNKIGVHPAHLSRLFQHDTGYPFSEYLMKQRMERARALLDFGLTISEAASSSGFTEVSYFSKMFSKYWGVGPHDIAYPN